MDLKQLFTQRKTTEHSRVTPISEALKDYIKCQLATDKPFSNYDELAYEYAMERIDAIAQQFNGNLDKKERGIPFKTPFLWGKMMVADQKAMGKMLAGFNMLATTTFERSLFTARFFHRFSDIEAHLGESVELRESQIEWLNMPEDYYLVFVNNSSPALPYRYMVMAYDAKDHQHYNGIFWNPGEKNKGEVFYL